MHISFEPLNESHFQLMLTWLETPHVKKWWDSDITYTIDSVKAKYTEYVKGFKKINGEEKPIYAYVIFCDRVPVGYIQVYNAYDFPRSKTLNDLPDNLAAFDIFIGDEKYLGRGIGALAIKKALAQHSYTYGFADPDIDNTSAIKAYEKAGFKKNSEENDVGELWMLYKIKRVRLSDYDLAAVESLFTKHFLPDDKLWLFGSRADLAKKGGDIDLYVETNAGDASEALKMKSNFLWDLENKIGEQKIDVVLNMLKDPYPLPIHEIAKTKGVRII